MTVLTDFLLARLADEEKALIDYCRGAAVPVTLATATHRVLKVDDGLAERVLAEIKAKRRIIERYLSQWEDAKAHPEDLASKGAVLALLGAVSDLALPYADHDDYTPAWPA